jgi:hypothetical protein
MNKMEMRGVGAIEAEIVRQYEANPDWNDAKDVIENIDPTKIFRAAITSMRVPMEEIMNAAVSAALKELGMGL